MQLIDLLTNHFCHEDVVPWQLVFEEALSWQQANLTDLHAKRFEKFIDCCVRVLSTEHHFHCNLVGCFIFDFIVTLVISVTIIVVSILFVIAIITKPSQ